MGKSFSIEAVFKAVDKMSNPLKGMNRNTSKFSRALRTDFAKAQRQVDQFSRNFKKKLGRGLRTAALGIGVAAAAGLGIAAKEFVDFENTITAASAKFGPAFQRGTEGFEQLGAVARKIGAETEFSAKSAAEGLDFLALAGFKADQAMSLLPGVVNLATAAQTDLASASDIASDSLGAFGLMTEDSDQLAKNFTRTMDVMAKTTTTSNTDLNTLFESVKKGGASFTAAGQSLESFNALAGAMANAGLKGAESGTQLRNIMLKMAKPSAEAGALMKKLGVVTADSDGNFRDIIDILGDFESGLAGMGTEQRSAALATIFGSRSVTGMNLLLDQGADSLRTYRSELEGSAGAAELMAEVMRGSLGNQIKSLQSAALELGFKFVEAFETQGGTAIKDLTTLIREFDVVPVLNGINKAIEVTTKLIDELKPFLPLMATITGAFLTYKAAMIGVATAQGLAAASNPIGAIAIAVYALIKALDELEKKFGFGQRIVDEFGGGIGSSEFELGRRERLATRQAEAALTDPRRQRLAERTAAPVSSAERAAVSREESTENVNITLSDPTGRASVSGATKGRGYSFDYSNSGAW